MSSPNLRAAKRRHNNVSLYDREIARANEVRSPHKMSMRHSRTAPIRRALEWSDKIATCWQKSVRSQFGGTHLSACFRTSKDDLLDTYTITAKGAFSRYNRARGAGKSGVNECSNLTKTCIFNKTNKRAPEIRKRGRINKRTQSPFVIHLSNVSRVVLAAQNTSAGRKKKTSH